MSSTPLSGVEATNDRSDTKEVPSAEPLSSPPLSTRPHSYEWVPPSRKPNGLPSRRSPRAQSPLLWVPKSHKRSLMRFWITSPTQIPDPSDRALSCRNFGFIDAEDTSSIPSYSPLETRKNGSKRSPYRKRVPLTTSWTYVCCLGVPSTLLKNFSSTSHGLQTSRG